MVLDERRGPCPLTCTGLVAISNPGNAFTVTHQNLKRYLVLILYSRLPFVAPLLKPLITNRTSRSNETSVTVRVRGGDQNIQAGDFVRVLSEEEIRRTLDRKNRLRGLGFMPEMEKFCGKQFRVWKKVERIKLETTGELRILKQPVFLLEGVYCDGEYHDQCDRSCFLFWRAEWLIKVQ
jgi:hypothetical protein